MSKPKNTWLISSLTFVKKGSNNAVITGKVYNDNIPIATLESFNE